MNSTSTPSSRADSLTANGHNGYDLDAAGLTDMNGRLPDDDGYNPFDTRASNAQHAEDRKHGSPQAATVVGGLYVADHGRGTGRLSGAGYSAVAALEGISVVDAIAAGLIDHRPREADVARWYSGQGQVWTPPSKASVDRAGLKAATKGLNATQKIALTTLDRRAAEGVPWAVTVVAKAQADNLDARVKVAPDAFTLGDLYSRYSAPVGDLLALPAMDERGRLESLRLLKEWTAAENKRATDMAKLGDVAPLDLDADVLSFDQLAQLEAVTPLIDGTLAEGQLAELIGEPGTFKTFIALSQMLCLAAGRDWCGHSVPKAVKTLYVLAEGANSVEVRSKAFCELHGIAADELTDKFFVYPRPVQMVNEDHMQAVRRFIELHGIRAVVFDTKARCTVGVEENSATDQGRAIANVEAVKEATGTAVLIVHHTARGADTGRGSTAWLGAVWSSLLGIRGARRSTKSTAVTIKCAKHKDWVDGCSHTFVMQEVTVSEDAMPGKTLAQRRSLAISAVNEVDVSIAEARVDTEREAQIKAIFHTYGASAGLTRSEGRKHARTDGIANTTYDRWFNRFVSEQVLVPMPGAAAHYRLKTDAAESTVGTDENRVEVNRLKQRLRGLVDAGEITARHTRTDVDKMLGSPSKTVFGQAWGWFEDQGRPGSDA